MAPVTSTNVCQNTYKDGKISQNALCKANKARRVWGQIPLVGGTAPTTGLDTRTFVPGEKMWITKIDVQPNFINVGLFTDAYNDVRYKADVKFPFPKGWSPTVDQADKLIADVFTAQPADNAGGQQQTAGAGQNPAPANTPPAPAPAPAPQQAAPPPIAPPPPPPADPKTIALKQTPDEVVAILGQPGKIIKLGTKQIYVYPDMKVTFGAGKVSDVQ